MIKKIGIQAYRELQATNEYLLVRQCIGENFGLLVFPIFSKKFWSKLEIDMNSKNKAKNSGQKVVSFGIRKKNSGQNFFKNLEFGPIWLLF